MTPSILLYLHLCCISFSFSLHTTHFIYHIDVSLVLCCVLMMLQSFGENLSLIFCLIFICHLCNKKSKPNTKIKNGSTFHILFLLNCSPLLLDIPPKRHLLALHCYVIRVEGILAKPPVYWSLYKVLPKTDASTFLFSYFVSIYHFQTRNEKDFVSHVVIGFVIIFFFFSFPFGCSLQFILFCLFGVRLNCTSILACFLFIFSFFLRFLCFFRLLNSVFFFSNFMSLYLKFCFLVLFVALHIACICAGNLSCFV